MSSLYDICNAAGLLDSPPPLTGQGGPGRGQGRKPIGSAPKITTSISVDVDVLTAARAVAVAQGISVSQLFEDAMRAALD